MLYLQCFYSTAQTLTSDISISTKMDMYHYKIDTTICRFLSIYSIGLSYHRLSK